MGALSRLSLVADIDRIEDKLADFDQALGWRPSGENDAWTRPPLGLDAAAFSGSAKRRPVTPRNALSGLGGTNSPISVGLRRGDVFQLLAKIGGIARRQAIADIEEPLQIF